MSVICERRVTNDGYIFLEFYRRDEGHRYVQIAVYKIYDPAQGWIQWSMESFNETFEMGEKVYGPERG